MSGREAFESVMRANGVDDFTRYHPDRDYISSTVQVAWAVWQARDAEIAAKDARIEDLEAALRLLRDTVRRYESTQGGARMDDAGEYIRWDVVDEICGQVLR